MWRPKTHLLTPREAREGFKRNSPWLFELTDVKSRRKIEEVFSYKYFGFPEEKKERQKHFLTHPFGFINRQLIEAVHVCAQKIMHFSKPGDNIVIFGNTPYFVGRALTFLISQDPSSNDYRRLIEFPFSGAPNGSRKDTNNDIDLKDIVTLERFAHLKKRMEKAGLSITNPTLQTHHTYFVDAVASGAGPAYVIEELLRDARKANLPFPSISLFSMCKIDITSKESSRNARIAHQNADSDEQITVVLPSIKNPHFTIPLRVTYAHGHGLLDNLPSNEWRIFPEYNAAYWQEEYDGLLQKAHPRHISVLFEFFDTNMHDIVRKS